MKSFLLAFGLFLSYLTSIAQETKPKLDVDHVIIWTEKDAPELKLFEKKGFISTGEPYAHTGFGTAGKYVRFYNVLLELLYVNDKADYDSNYHRKLSSERDKWRKNRKSPFGLAFYMTPFDSTKIPFANKVVKAAWMKPNMALYTAASSFTHDQEPILFIVNPNIIYSYKVDTKEDIEKIENEGIRNFIRKYRTHPNGVEKLTDLKVICSTKRFSPTVKALKEVENLEIVKGKEHLLEMTFDENRQKQTIDFRPQLPVVIRY